MSSPEPGRIVLVEAEDRAGRDPKHRPVLITDVAEIEEDKIIVGVCISTQVKREPQWEVALPWDPQRRAKTGLNKEAVAVCSWLVEFTENEIVDYKGTVSSQKLLEVLQKVKEFKSAHPAAE